MSGFAEEPRAPYSARMHKADFFAWLQTREGGRYELKNGQIVVHAGVSRKHHRVVSGFAHALMSRLSRDDWDVAIGEFAVEIGEDIRYPDILVERRADDDGEAYSTSQPLVLIAVLSPSSGGRDFHERLAEYVSLPSLQTYIIASQDEPIVWVWHRDAVTQKFNTLPIEITGLERSIAINVLGLALPLAEIYRGISTK